MNETSQRDVKTTRGREKGKKKMPIKIKSLGIKISSRSNKEYNQTNKDRNQTKG